MRNKPNVVATTAKHPDSRSKISRYRWMQPTYMRSVSFWGKFTSGSRIRASRSDLLKLPIGLWTETELRSINSQKKKTRPTSSHLDQTSVVNKGFILWLSGKFFLRKFFFTRVANHSTGFDFSCPLTDLAIQ